MLFNYLTLFNMYCALFVSMWHPNLVSLFVCMHACEELTRNADLSLEYRQTDSLLQVKDGYTVSHRTDHGVSIL